MTPLMFLGLMLVVTLGAWMLHRSMRGPAVSDLARLAGELGMQYCPADQFHLCGQIAARFPICGAADVSVRDVMYGRRECGGCYIVTVEYTEGVLGTKHRRRRVGLLMERGGATGGPIVLARADATVPEQYRELAGRVTGG